MPYLLARRLIKLAHDEAGAYLWLYHHELLDVLQYFRLQEAPVVNLELVVVDHLEFVYALVKTNLVIPLESNVYGTRAWLRRLVEPEKPRLVSQVATKTEKYKLVAAILLLVDRKHQPLWITQFAVGIYRIEHRAKRLGKALEIEAKFWVLRSALLLCRKYARIELGVTKVKAILGRITLSSLVLFV